MKNLKNTVVIITALILLTACGHNTGDRALSGAAIGAGVGAVAGAVTGGNGTGALIGGAVGAAAGALTSDKDVNLGKPAWR